jgi:cation-transporting P-type ATPase 13A2
VTVWCFDDYIIYALTIAFFTIISIIRSLINLRNNYKRMRELLFQDSSVEVFRYGKFELISSQDLVPGDIIKIIEDMVIPADCILLEGKNEKK